jgi:hypothetical protein
MGLAGVDAEQLRCGLCCGGRCGEGAQEGEKGCMPGPVERVKQCLQRKQTGPCATGTARPLCTAAVQMAAWLFWCCGNQSVSVAEQMPGA